MVSPYLFIKLDEVRLEHFRDVSGCEMILIHSLTVALVLLSFAFSSLGKRSWLAGYSIQRDRDVFTVSNLF